MWKYPHSRAYRVALFDAGHLSQTVQLVATALGLRTWITAAFYDNELNDLLALDGGGNEHALLVVGLGTGDVDAIDRDMRNEALVPID
jgi:SagB-type dehydrogenase family enzyme